MLALLMMLPTYYVVFASDFPAQEKESQPLSAAMIRNSLEDMKQGGHDVPLIHDVDATLR